MTVCTPEGGPVNNNNNNNNNNDNNNNNNLHLKRVTQSNGKDLP